MGQDCVIKLVRNKIYILMMLLYSINIANAQVIESIEDYEMTTESKEENEEILQKLKSKISVKEFLNDESLYSIYLSEKQFKSIKEHIELNGELIDLLELQSIPNFTSLDYNRLKLILFFDPSDHKIEKKSIRISNRMIYQSDIDKNYIGGNWGNYQQIKITTEKGYKIGLAREVDIGENTGSFYGDHHSYYIYKHWRNKEFSIGEYQIYHGFGLLVGQGYSVNFGGGGINNLIQNKWLSNASQTEVNTMKGGYLKQSFNNLTYSIGYSKQKIDLGSPTGYHRIQNELSKKNRDNEQVLLVGLDQNFIRFRYAGLLIYNIENNKIGGSLGLQHYYRNTISFLELASYKQHKAYTFGMMVLIAKDVQLNLSHTHFDNNYKTPWQSYTTQGYSENDGNGYTINIGFPMKKKWIGSYTYKTSSKMILDEAKVGKESSAYHSVRVDKSFSKSMKFTQIILIQALNNNAATIRTKSSFQNHTLDKFQQEFSFQINTNKIEWSRAISVNFKYKERYWKAIYSIGVFNIKSKLPIYYSIENVAQSGQTIGVFNSGMVQCAGFSMKIKRKWNASLFIQNTSNSIELSSKYKLTFSIQYL